VVVDDCSQSAHGRVSDRSAGIRRRAELLARGGNVGMATDSLSHDLITDLGMGALFGMPWPVLF